MNNKKNNNIVEYFLTKAVKTVSGVHEGLPPPLSKIKHFIFKFIPVLFNSQNVKISLLECFSVLITSC